MQISDKLEDLVPLIHGVQNSKKVIKELIKHQFPKMRKSHIEVFLKDCFVKEKMPQDKKVRLFAKADALEKYGAGQSLLE